MEHAAKTIIPGPSREFSSHQQEGSATSKKRPWDVVDDASSTTTSTSMSSESRERRDNQCKKCKKPTKPWRVFYRCRKCKYNYHWNCHKPNPGHDFICFDCTKRIKAPSTQPGSKQSSTPAAKNPKMCVVGNCEKVAKEGQKLCFFHAMDEKHRAAKAAAAAAPIPLNSRPHKVFNKTKIYPANAETKKAMSERGVPVTKRHKISNEFSTASSEISPKPKIMLARSPSTTYEARMNESESRAGFGRVLPNFWGLEKAISSANNGFASQNQSTRSVPVPRTTNGFASYNPSTRPLLAPLVDDGWLSRLNSARASPALNAEWSPAYTPPPAIPSSKQWIDIEDSDDSESVYSPKLDTLQDEQAGLEAPNSIPKASAGTVDSAAQSKDEAINIPAEPYTELIKLPHNATVLAHQIALLPQQRELEVRPGKVLKFDKVEANLEAALAYQRGRLAALACDKCGKGNGVFLQCVVLLGFFGGACCSCRYSNMGSICCHRSDSGSKKTPPSQSEIAATNAQPPALISIHSRSSRGGRKENNDSGDRVGPDASAQSNYVTDEDERKTVRRPIRTSLRPRQDQSEKAQSKAPQAPKMSAVPKAKETSRAEFLDEDEDLGEIDDMLASIGEPVPYDSSILDSYLAQSSKEHNPTHAELLTTQIWGAIDPRISWPKQFSADEHAEKQAEIRARGTRKQNLGKNFGEDPATLLTPRVRNERAEKGWDVHQARAWPEEEDKRERTRIMHLKELFGITDLNIKRFVPAFKDKQLVMVEKGPSRQDEKVFPVSVAS